MQDLIHYGVVCVHGPFQNETINHVDKVAKILAYVQFFADVQKLFLLFLKFVQSTAQHFFKLSSEHLISLKKKK